MNEKDIEFIATRYHRGRFSVDNGWKRLGILPISLWRRYRVAAAVAAMVVLTASAVIIYKVNTATSISPQTEISIPAADRNMVKVIDFENTPLDVVVDKIDDTYGVKVTGLPESPAEYRLSLHYEGTATDLVETINEILGTELTVAEQ